MTEDIVARLRCTNLWHSLMPDGRLHADSAPHEAADEIERLRAELAAARERKPIVYSPDAQAMSDRVKSAEAERDALRELLLRWDALINYQFSGSHDAMSALTKCAQETAQALYGDPPWPSRARAVLEKIKGGGDE